MAEAGPNTVRGERAKRAILDAARPVFARDGYAAASLNQIIEASGLTKGGFYFHFPSKQALALAVLADQQRHWIDEMNLQINRHPRAIDRLFAAPRVIAEFASRGEGPLALGKQVEELARDPDLRDEVCGSIRVWLKTVTTHFKAAQNEGTIRADVDAATLAEVGVGGFLGMQAITDQLGDGRLAGRVDSLIYILHLASIDQGSDRHELRRDSGRGPGRRRRDRNAAGT